ncbi:MAG TPA: dihydrolipoamide acetyltransferase family protein [Fimbriimonadaceae bacterium]|nr:dihydrolipoamide acetyltransferase family protein [Fimbriimonadaceae bacterium]
MTEVIMPKMGDGMEEGTLLEWLKKEGDAVKAGDVLGTIQTDKATLELEAPGAGVLSGILIQNGETVPVGRPIAALLKEGENLPGNWKSGAAEATAQPVEPNGAATEQAAPNGAASEPAAPAPEPAVSEGRVKASPLARRIASERGVDLASVTGSGPGGRIVERDVLAAKPGATPAATKAAPYVAQASDEVMNLNRLRQLTAQRTAQSKQQVPHFYVTVEVDVERIGQLRAMFEEEESGKVSINDFVVKACALALRDMPEVNATFTSATTVTKLGAVNVGIAVAIEEGLTVAVVRDADRLSLRQIAAKSKELVGKAKENKLTMEELTGSTFSISNMGMLDVDNFIAIVNQPNSAIVAISTARKKVVVGENDEIEIRQRMNVSASFDHRVVDGAIGARFINVVKSYLENPTRLLG